VIKKLIRTVTVAILPSSHREAPEDPGPDEDEGEENVYPLW
jgi:hypothetical protein